MTRVLPRGGLLVAGLIALLTVTGPRAGGFTYYLYGSYAVVWTNAEAVRYLSPSTFVENSDVDLLYRGALGLWMIVPSADFTYWYDYYEPDAIDNYDGYSDTIAVSASELDPGVLAVTYMVNNADVWYDMDMVFADYPANVGWNFYADPTCEEIRDPTTYGVTFLLVATHELGHALGLGHDPQGTEPAGSMWFIATMNPAYPAGGPIGEQNVVQLHADDRGGLRALYPHSGTATTVVDLANSGYSRSSVVGKAAPATFTPTTVDPGGTVTLRSVIENFGNANVMNVRQGFYLNAWNGRAGESLGELWWDLAAGDGFDFDVDATLPADLPAGQYEISSLLDDLEQVAEEYEDNNRHVYCDALTVRQLAPVINDAGQDYAACGTEYVGPTPAVTHPLNMAPLTWSIDNPPTGMWIEPATGVVHWPSPIESSFLYTIYLRATNAAGSDTTVLFLGVEHAVPEIVAIADQEAIASVSYTGPTPVLSDAACMEPIINWSLDAAPAGMTINHATGVVTWPAPTCGMAPQEIQLRATNSVGNGVVTWYLHVLNAVAGDLDCDGGVDVGDAMALGDCMTGPDVYTIPPACGVDGFARADLDVDADVDLFDFALLQRAP